MKDLLKVMRALSDPSRVKIIKMLKQKVMCVCELTCALGLAQPTVSRHLKVLEDAGLISSRKEGLWVNYFLPQEAGNLFAAAMLSHLDTWLEVEPEIINLKEKLPLLSRENICKR